MNIYDISEKAGVSIATVSRVLNGSEKVSKKTREKVLAIIEETKYMPNAFARSLGLNSMYTVGILCSDASDVYQAQSIQFLERELRKNSYATILCCTGNNLEERQHYLEFLMSRNVDTVIFIGSQFIENDPKANDYIIQSAKKIPIFILNGDLRGENVYSILCDDYEATKNITNLIFKKGGTLPVFLYRNQSYSSKRKMDGFLEACKENGLEDPQNNVLRCPGSIGTAKELLENIRKKNINFDFVVAADDELAVGAVKFALSNRISIPDHLQISGYNNSVLSRCSTPEITTIDNRAEYMCITAVSIMVEVLQNKNLPSKMMFSGDIIERNTTLS